MDKKFILGFIVGAISIPLIVGAAITTSQIADNAITSKKIKTGNVKNSDVADGAITKYKIAAGAVTGSRIANGVVARVDLDPTLQYNIPEFVSNRAISLDYPVIGANSCTDRSIFVSGAVQGQRVVANPEAVFGGMGSQSSTIWTSWVYADDSVKLRVCNTSSSPTADIPAEYWMITVFSYPETI